MLGPRSTPSLLAIVVLALTSFSLSADAFCPAAPNAGAIFGVVPAGASDRVILAVCVVPFSPGLAECRNRLLIGWLL
jgi:hypothetical protein